MDLVSPGHFSGPSPWALLQVWLIASVLLGLINFAEASITALSVARLKGLKAIYGGPFWEAAKRWIRHPEEYLTLLLLANNLLEVAYAWALLSTLRPLIRQEPWRDAVVWLAGGTINLFLLTIFPKLLARRLSHGLLGAWILRVLYAVIVPFYPVLRLFFVSVAKISGGGPGRTGALGKEVSISFEELRELVDSSRAGRLAELPAAPMAAPADQQQAFGRAATEMMANYMRLRDVTAGHAMTPRADVLAVDWNSWVGLPHEHPDRQNLEFRLMTAGHTRTLALRGEWPMGYIHAKDLLTTQAELTKDVLLRPIPAVHARQKLISILPLLLRDCPIAFVVENNDWTGIITAEDLLEEITGEILDEFEARKKRRPSIHDQQTGKHA